MKSGGRFGGIPGKLMLFAFTAAMLWCGVPGLCHGAAADAPYYAPKKPIDLGGRSVQFVFTDLRGEYTQLACSDAAPAGGTEFDDKDGFDFFKNYLLRMAKESSASIEHSSDNVIQVQLEVLSPRIFGFLFLRVHGLTQFSVKSKSLNNRYCSDMKDGDPDSPLSLTSVGTRKSAMRTMVSGSTTKTVEAFLADLSKSLVEQPPHGEQENPEVKTPDQPSR
ncbi:MAG TPA: hypothetical protein VGJ94_06950 [Syntrophorhabdaceae bacterium]|jgi:hypothetical protein